MASSHNLGHTHLGLVKSSYSASLFLCHHFNVYFKFVDLRNAQLICYINKALVLLVYAEETIVSWPPQGVIFL